MLVSKQINSTEGRVSEGNTDYAVTNSHPSGQLSFGFRSKVGNGNGFRDPAFADNKTQPLHRWVPWIAGFSAQFVQDCFETFLNDRKKISRPVVLDPFAGVGTTLVQAMLNGFDSIGFEINPYAALGCRAKLNSPKLDLEKLEAHVRNYQDIANNGHRNG